MELTELKALAEKVTPGSWHWDSDPVKGDPLGRTRFRVVAKGRTITQCYYSSGDDMAQREAAYIAAANPAAILELITQLEDAQGEIRALRATEVGLRDQLAAVEADRAQRVPNPVYLSARALIDAARRDWPSSSAHRARVLEAANALESALLASTPAQPAQQELEPTKAVAYLDIGTGGYVDLGSEVSPEELAALPRGRHMLVIAGTYGIDGYKPATHQEPPQPVERKPIGYVPISAVEEVALDGYLPVYKDHDIRE